MDSGEVITLNVGGAEFATTVATLTKVLPSFFFFLAGKCGGRLAVPGCGFPSLCAPHAAPPGPNAARPPTQAAL